MQGKSIQVTISGVRPLLMHNGQLADPLSEWAKELKKATSNKKLAPEDKAAQCQYCEFMGGLYWAEETGPYIPATNIEKLIRDGAAARKQGKASQADVQVTAPLGGGEDVPLIYDGSREREKLLATNRWTCGVRVGQSRVMRTRPRFNEWSLSFTVQLTPWASLDEGDIEAAISDAGRRVGLGDWKPKFGLFVVDQFKAVT